MTKRERQQTVMKLNTLKRIEETHIRVKLNKEGNVLYRLQLLSCFRLDASLRQIDNARQINFS